MNKKEIIISELDSASDNILDEVIDFVQFLKYKKLKNENEIQSFSKSISKYRGIAKGIWDKDANDVLSEMRDDER